MCYYSEDIRAERIRCPITACVANVKHPQWVSEFFAKYVNKPLNGIASELSTDLYISMHRIRKIEIKHNDCIWPVRQFHQTMNPTPIT